MYPACIARRKRHQRREKFDAFCVRGQFSSEVIRCLFGSYLAVTTRCPLSCCFYRVLGA